MKRYLQALALLFVAFALQPNAQATSTAIVVDQKVCTGSAAASGGTMTCDWATTTDRATWLVARVGLSNASAAHLANAGYITCEYVVENKNGTVSAPAAIGSSNNPASSGNLAASRAEASDGAYTNPGGGTYPTCTWSISGTSARVTVTNQSVSAVAADVTVWIQAFNFGSQ